MNHPNGVDCLCSLLQSFCSHTSVHLSTHFRSVQELFYFVIAEVVGSTSDDSPDPWITMKNKTKNTKRNPQLFCWMERVRLNQTDQSIRKQKSKERIVPEEATILPAELLPSLSRRSFLAFSRVSLGVKASPFLSCLLALPVKSWGFWVWRLRLDKVREARVKREDLAWTLMVGVYKEGRNERKKEWMNVCWTQRVARRECWSAADAKVR